MELGYIITLGLFKILIWLSIFIILIGTIKLMDYIKDIDFTEIMKKYYHDTGTI